MHQINGLWYIYVWKWSWMIKIKLKSLTLQKFGRFWKIIQINSNNMGKSVILYQSFSNCSAVTGHGPSCWNWSVVMGHIGFGQLWQDR